MKKLIGIVLAAIFLTTGIAAATDFTLSGSYNVQGQYYDNAGGVGVEGSDATYGWVDDETTPPFLEPDWTETDAATLDRNAEAYGNFDHELSVDATWQIDDSTKVFARFEMRDETWAATDYGTSGSENSNVGDNDDNIVVERVWGDHTFAATSGTLTVGLMGGGVWGTSFFDGGYDAYRVKYAQPTAIGQLIGVYQKYAEGGEAAALDDDTTDFDIYVVGLVTEVGSLRLMPLLVYGKDETKDASSHEFHLAATGDLGAVSFEAEADYQAYSDDYAAIGSLDSAVFGLYGKVSFNAGPATIGVLGAWGSYDDDRDHAFSFGDDFEAGGAMIIGDDMELVGSDLGAGFLVAATASFAANEKLTVDGYVGYWAANDDYAFDEWGGADGANAYEISGGIAYAITANLTYSIRAGFADLDIDGMDLESSMNATHKLAFSF